jgi:hypothetical protein
MFGLLTDRRGDRVDAHGEVHMWCAIQELTFIYHGRKRSLCGVKGGREHHSDKIVPFAIFKFMHCSYMLHPRIVHKNVHTSEYILSLRHHAADALGLTQVGCRRVNLDVVLGKLFCLLLQGGTRSQPPIKVTMEYKWKFWTFLCSHEYSGA